MNKSPRLLRIEFQRVQTYLFRVPRLADMDGANALLGDLMRRRLPDALRDYLAPPSDHDLLSDLKALEAELSERDDPLIPTHANGDGEWLQPWDRPSRQLKQGLIVRDGGRVWALVASESLQQAKETAGSVIEETCPGLGFTFHDSAWTGNSPVQDNGSPASSIASDVVGLPCFLWCEDSGQEPASVELTIGDDTRRVSRASEIKRNARRRREHLWDTASLLYRVGALPAPDTSNEARTSDFGDIAGRGGYLAVVHVDGNSIGRRAADYGQKIAKESKDPFVQQVALERFFLAMRSATRHALVSALQTQFGDHPSSYRLLMTGGDDVLLVCGASLALPFVRDFAGALTEIDLPDEAPLTIGAGIAIARPQVPFYRLHQLAYELAGNAKRIALSASDEHRSVVDWQITTASWIEGVEAHRSTWDALMYLNPGASAPERLYLSGKPYPVLTGGGELSLTDLLTLRARLESALSSEDQGTRSQLKNFLAELRRGRRYAEMIWQELPDRFRKPLFEAGQSMGIPVPSMQGDGLWYSLDKQSFRTWLPDLIEVLELPRLGAATEADRQGPSEDAEAAA